MPSLEGAQAWLNRAEEHLLDIESICDAITERECDAMIGSVHVDPPQPGIPVGYAYTKPTASVPVRLRVVVGEAVQAMRRSLDYLVYEVAFLDSGVEQQGTQFPIDNSEKIFDGRRKPHSKRTPRCFLIGISDKHAAAIKRLQPFPRHNWTAELRAISNPDKHRRLTITWNETSTTIRGWARGTAQGETARITPETFSFLMQPENALGSMYMKFHVTVYVALDKGVGLVQRLRKHKAEVAHVLADFAPCFAGKCCH